MQQFVLWTAASALDPIDRPLETLSSPDIKKCNFVVKIQKPTPL
jgi:hypothetical protein